MNKNLARADGLLVLLIHNRAQVRLGIVSATRLQGHGFPLQQGHASHTGAAKGGVDDGVYRALQTAVFQNKGVVLRLTLGLDAFAAGGGDRADMLADFGAAGKDNRLIWVRTLTDSRDQAGNAAWAGAMAPSVSSLVQQGTSAISSPAEAFETGSYLAVPEPFHSPSTQYFILLTSHIVGTFLLLV